MTVKDKLMIYIYRKMNELENEKEILRQQRRLQPMDSLDIYENMRNEIYRQAFNDMVNDLFNVVINCK